MRKRGNRSVSWSIALLMNRRLIRTVLSKNHSCHHWKHILQALPCALTVVCAKCSILKNADCSINIAHHKWAAFTGIRNLRQEKLGGFLRGSLMVPALPYERFTQKMWIVHVLSVVTLLRSTVNLWTRLSHRAIYACSILHADHLSRLDNIVANFKAKILCFKLW